MKTKEKVKEIVMILGMMYLTLWKYEDTVLIKPMESDKEIDLKIEDNTLVVSTKEDIIHVLSLDQDAGRCVMELEQVIIDTCGLQHKPLALSMYLYCRLLGILWGVKASKALQGRDPLPGNKTFIELKGPGQHEGIEYTYWYTLELSGKIAISKSWQPTMQEGTSITPEQYLEDPEGTIIKFFEFFGSIKEITSVGKG